MKKGNKMNQAQKIKSAVSTAVVCLAIATLAGCTSTGGGSSAPSAGTGSSGTGSSGTGGAAVSGKGIFSSLNELKYTPSAQGEYKIGPNDVLVVDVFRVPELSGREVRVSESGSITLPLSGSMRVKGLSQKQVEQQLTAKLSKSFLQNPQVSVSIKEFTSKEVTVGGSVKNPGVFPMKGAMTLSQAVTLAGGLVTLADPKKVVLFRPKSNGTFKAYNVDLVAIRDNKMRDPYVNGKDQIIVHESGSRVWLQRVTGVARGFINPLSF